MPGDLTARLRITADGTGFTVAVRGSKRALDDLKRSVERGTGAAGRYTAATDETAKAARRASRSFLEAHGSHLRYIAAIAGGAGVARAVRGTLAYADSYTQVSNAVRIATSSGAEFAAVQEGLFAVSQRTRAPLESVADLYQKLSLSAGELGASQTDLLKVIEGVGQALVINGTSAAQSSGALLQLSQALGGSVVRAEEFNSLLEGAKPLLVAVANNFDAAGGSVSRLRELVNAGEVSSREFFEALQAGLPELERDFARTSATVAQGVTQFSNSMTRFVGSVDEALGVSGALASELEGLADWLAEVDVEAFADNLATTAKVAAVLAAAVGGRLAASLLRAAGLFALAAARSLAAAGAMRTLTVAARGAWLALGGLPGLIGAAIGGFVAFNLVQDDTAEAAERAAARIGDEAKSVADLTREMVKLTAAQRDARILELETLKATASTEATSARRAATTARTAATEEAEAVRTIQGRAPRFFELGESPGSVAVLERRATQAEARADTAEGRLAELEQRLADERTARRRAITIESMGGEGPTVGGAAGPAEDAGAAAGAGAAERNAAELARITRTTQDEIVRLTKSRIDQSILAEERAVEKIEALRGQPGVTETAIQAARTEVARRGTIQRAQLEREAAAEADRLAAAEAERLNERREREQALAIDLAEARGATFEAQRLAAEAEYERRIEAGASLHDAMLALERDYRRISLDETRAAEEERLEVLRESRERELAEARGFRDADAEAKFAHRKRIIEEESGETRRVAQVRTAFAKFQLQEGRKTAKDRLAIVRDSAGALASHSKKAFRIQQAASLATAVVNIAQGVSAALAKGFPIGTIEAALIGAAGAAEIATIRSQRPPTGFARGGVVHDATFFGARGLGPAGGVAGEGRGPEGILPLARGPDGVLGVRVQGGGGARAITIAPSITVAAPPGQDPAETGDAIAGRIVALMPAMIDARLQDQQRSGGLLNPQATV